jgi:hypothetical protein
MIYHGCLVFMLCDQVTIYDSGPTQRFPELFGGFPIGARHTAMPIALTSHATSVTSHRINIETTSHCLRKSKLEECIF